MGKSKKKFKPAYLQNPAGSIDMEAVTKATHLFFKQRQAAKNHYYHVIERGRQLLNLQLLIKKPLKEAYWVAGKKMCGLHVGPLDMYSDVWFLFKYAAARLKLVDWWRCRKITLNGCHYTYKLFWLAKLNLLLSCQGSWIIDYFCWADRFTIAKDVVHLCSWSCMEDLCITMAGDQLEVMPHGCPLLSTHTQVVIRPER